MRLRKRRKHIPVNPHLLECTSQRRDTVSPGKIQKESQEDQGTLNSLGGSSLALSPLPGPPGLPSRSSLGTLELPLGKCFQGDVDNGFNEIIGIVGAFTEIIGIIGPLGMAGDVKGII